MDWSPPPKLWLPPKPAIVRAASLKDLPPALGSFLPGMMGPLIADGERDPYFSSVVLLCHFDANSNDYSPFGHTVALNGGAALTSAQSEYGTQSLYLDGSNDYASIIHASAFDMPGDYTIEASIRRDGAQITNARVCCHSNANQVTPYLNASNQLEGHSVASAAKTTTAIADATWTKACLMRASGTNYVFVNGVVGGTTASDSANADGAGFYIGVDGVGAGQWFKGWLNEVRVTKAQRYSTSGYTPRTSPFPNA